MLTFHSLNIIQFDNTLESSLYNTIHFKQPLYIWFNYYSGMFMFPKISSHSISNAFLSLTFDLCFESKCIIEINTRGLIDGRATTILSMKTDDLKYHHSPRHKDKKSNKFINFLLSTLFFFVGLMPWFNENTF